MNFRLRLLFTILVYCSVAGMLASMVMPGQERNIRLGLVVCDGLMLGMAFLAFWRCRRFYGVWAFLVLLLTSTLTFLYTSDRFGILEHLNGLRDTVFFFTSLIVVYDLYHSEDRAIMLRRFTQFLVVFAIVQIPLTIIQFIQFGAGDGVGGTYGTAGGSGQITQLLFIVCFFLAVRFASLDDGSHFSLKKLPFLLPLLIPCAINETKISFVLLGVFILLVAGSRKRVFRSLPIFALGGLLVYLLNHFYSSTVEDTRNILDIDFVEKYLVTNQTDVGGDMPRFQRLVLMFKMMGDDVGSILLGMGYGVMGGGNILGVSRLGRTLYYLVTGSRILLFRAWIQGGFVAVVTMAFAMFAWMRSTAVQYATLRKFYWFLGFSIFIVWVYSEAMLDRTFALVTTFLMIWTSEGGLVEDPETAHAATETEEATQNAEA
jgi:hypothetical protein